LRFLLAETTIIAKEGRLFRVGLIILHSTVSDFMPGCL
jgi:cytochrome c biogenesis protein ResB